MYAQVRILNSSLMATAVEARYILGGWSGTSDRSSGGRRVYAMVRMRALFWMTKVKRLTYFRGMPRKVDSSAEGETDEEKK